MLAGIALLIYALAPFIHGLIHPDHEVQAVFDAVAAERGSGHHQSPAHPHQHDDCALFQFYAGHGVDGVAPVPSLESSPMPRPVAQAPVFGAVLLPAGAPRGVALGRGPPQIA